MTKGNSLLHVLKAQGVQLPQKESLNDPSLSLTIFERMKKLQEESGEEAPDMLEEFNALVYDYPYSMLASRVTETEATLICLYYFWRPRHSEHYRGVHLGDWQVKSLYETKPHELELYLYDKMCERIEREDFRFYSYEQLAILFNKSKSTVHEVIQNHKDRVSALLGGIGWKRGSWLCNN